MLDEQDMERAKRRELSLLLASIRERGLSLEEQAAFDKGSLGEPNCYEEGSVLHYLYEEGVNSSLYSDYDY